MWTGGLQPMHSSVRLLIPKQAPLQMPLFRALHTKSQAIPLHDRARSIQGPTRFELHQGYRGEGASRRPGVLAS